MNKPTGSGTLVIENVDFELLEKQRLCLIGITMDEELQLTSEELELLDGLLNMLDEWSDQIYFGEKP